MEGRGLGGEAKEAGGGGELKEVRRRRERGREGISCSVDMLK